MKETHLKVLRNFTDEALEGEFTNKELSGLLVSPNFTKSDSTRPETMGLLDTTGGVLQMLRSEKEQTIEGLSAYCCGLASGRLGGELFARGLA
jgi:hypothetical protein